MAPNEPRRVLIVNHDASRTGAPAVGGQVAGALGSGGWDTTLVCRWRGSGADDLGALANRSIGEPASTLRVAIQRVDALRPAAHAVSRVAIRSVLRRVKPDLVWCNSVMTAEYAVAATAMGIPTVLHSHERAEDVAAALRNSGFTASGTASSPLLTPVACATGTAELFAAELGLPDDRVHVLHSAPDLDAARAAAASSPNPYRTSPVVVACGLGNERKGIDVFNEAAERSLAAGHTWSWVWVGKVPQELRVDAVEYVGEQPSAAAWIAGADVVVVPSRVEQLSLVVIEAMALGTPVVASDLPGPRELLADTGRWVPVADPAAIVEAVERLLSDPAGAADLARQAEDRCRQLWGLPNFRQRACEIADHAQGV